MEPFSELHPTALWKYFGEICNIPRLSKHEGPIIEYLLNFADQQGLECHKDDAGNILIRKPATRGYENLKTVILQSHLDMVGEKTLDSDHNFMKDPIKVMRDGDWITAEGTTLGADDGIGIAAQMTVLSDDGLEHGPVECLFTVDEESGMTGAIQLQAGFLGGRILLNLDSEDWGELFIGCAGGIDTLGKFEFTLQKPQNHSMALRISVTGLRGGHSGDEIHKSPGNAIKVLNRILLETGHKHGLSLANIEGGNLRNAIPREAIAEFCVPAENFREFARAFAAARTSLFNDLKEHEPEMKIELAEIPVPDAVLRYDQQDRFLKALDACPHGVIRWSQTIDNLVETSTNLASVKFEDPGRAIVVTSQRSSVDPAKKEISVRVANILLEGGARTEHSDGYPGWTPNPDSEILRVVSSTYKDLFGEKPQVKAIHAGLECGLILEKYPGLDMVSFGPTILGAHTPEERLSIETTEKFWKLLLAVLKHIPRAG